MEAERKKVTIHTLREKMEAGQPISMLTAYDYPLALLEEQAGIDIILVGDSLGMTIYGYDTTLPVTMDMMLRHAEAVRRAAPTAFVIGDMPYMSYQASRREAIHNAGRFMAEAGVDAVKMEGGAEMASTVRALVKSTIPVMGHIGLTPQSLSQLGGFKAQGRTAEAAIKIIKDALALEEAGIFALLVEAVPPPVLKAITERVKVPVIGLGSGPHAHGQLVIVHDMLGFFERFTPKFVKKYANVSQVILEALTSYRNEVEAGIFPGPGSTYAYGMPAEEEGKLEELLSRGL